MFWLPLGYPMVSMMIGVSTLHQPSPHITPGVRQDDAPKSVAPVAPRGVGTTEVQVEARFTPLRTCLTGGMTAATIDTAADHGPDLAPVPPLPQRDSLTPMTASGTDTLPAKLTIQQAAAWLGVNEKTVRRYIAQGRLKAARVGPKLIRVERESLLALAKPIGCY
jgi:excisionase family DNA binding protein